MSTTACKLGMVKFYNDQKGFGMITEIGGALEDDSASFGNDFFVHVNDLIPRSFQQRGARRLYTGEYVVFDVGDPHGVIDETKKKRAVNVRGPRGGPLLMEHGQLVYESYSRTYLKSSVNNNNNTQVQEGG